MAVRSNLYINIECLALQMNVSFTCQHISAYSKAHVCSGPACQSSLNVMLKKSWNAGKLIISRIKHAKKKAAPTFLTLGCSGHPCELVTRYTANPIYECLLTSKR